MTDPIFAHIGLRVMLSGHFDNSVILDDIRPLGANGSAGTAYILREPAA